MSNDISRPEIKLVTGKVVGGKIEVEGESLKKGSTVTVLAHEDDETFELRRQLGMKVRTAAPSQTALPLMALSPGQCVRRAAQPGCACRRRSR